jgi:hypothetical protein
MRRLIQVLFTSQVFLGLGGEIFGPQLNPESFRMARLLLRYFWEIFRSVPEFLDPPSFTLE